MEFELKIEDSPTFLPGILETTILLQLKIYKALLYVL